MSKQSQKLRMSHTWDSAKARTTIPANLVMVMPERTELPMVTRVRVLRRILWNRWRHGRVTFWVMTFFWVGGGYCSRTWISDLFGTVRHGKVIFFSVQFNTDKWITWQVDPLQHMIHLSISRRCSEELVPAKKKLDPLNRV